MKVKTNIFRGVARSKKGKEYPILEWCFEFDGKKSELTEENFPSIRIFEPEEKPTSN